MAKGMLKTGNPHPSLRELITSGVKRASKKEEQSLFAVHPYYGEVIDNKAYVNEEKLRNEGSTGDFVNDMIFGESLHNLDKTSPYWYNRLKEAANIDPEVMQWKQDSYNYSKSTGENRSIDDWWNVSRFDQVVGGYLLGGEDANIHTMRGWDKNLPFGTNFRDELENFKQALDR
tara:strand:+ start:19 stop:540 length:522 start_codon:yes stop_codon:yes gene_type:complete